MESLKASNVSIGNLKHKISDWAVNFPLKLFRAVSLHARESLTKSYGPNNTKFAAF